jgi:hypothetical protein
VWQAINPDSANHADIILNGQEHHYERLSPMTWSGTPDDIKGTREFNVGTGGESLNSEASVIAIHPESKARIFKFGVLRLELRGAGYSWAYLPDDGSPAADTGSGSCH